MTPVLTEADLEPYAASGFAWRWRNPKYEVLPAGVLQSIRAVRRPKAEEYFQPSLTIDKWVRERPMREIETEAHEQKVVSDWLRACVPQAEMVIASWSQDEAVYLPWSVFANYWSSFCYKSSDDVTVWPQDERWGLSFTYRGAFYWRSLG